MSLKLYLMRHAQSVDKQPGQTDKERELTERGMRESMQMGAYLKGEKNFFDLFLSSTATRAKLTSQYVLEAMKLPTEKIHFEDELFDASVRTLYEFILKLDDTLGSVIIVGHNPTITYLAEILTKEEIGNMATAGIAIINFNVSSWKEVHEGTGELVRYICPELL
jgi:phosphohistidine phosphatase